MGFLESFVKNVFCDVVKPRIGSVVKVDLSFGPDHTGIYIGNDEIVEVANIDGVATVRIVSAEEFIEGDDLFSRSGMYIYVACKQDRDGNCIAMGSKDIADRARAAVGQTSQYDFIFNNCHMFTEYCITGKKEDLCGLLIGVEKALDDKFINCGYERLADIWRSTGESRGSNPSFYDSVEDEMQWEFEEVLEKAEIGDVEAQFQVAEKYYLGLGVEEDAAEAVIWYEKAALQGHVEAMEKLGIIYYVGEEGVEEDEEESQKWYTMAAEAGSKDAREKLGYLF